jgi:hypothetical protein
MAYAQPSAHISRRALDAAVTVLRRTDAHPYLMNSFFESIEATSVAQAVAGSASLTAWLSALHVLGFVVITGSALVANLRAAGVLLMQSALGEVLRPANRAILLGLAISVLTGALLFSARAADAAGNNIFRLKMLLLIVAATVQFSVLRRIGNDEQPILRRARTVAAIALSLWLGLALAACAFILLE